MRLEGRVQGVGFRVFVSRRAASYPLVEGYVRNTPDGAVEIVAEGPFQDVRAFATEAAKGPRGSLVLNVQEDWSEPIGGFNGFDLRM
jgi:acylphosphatase